MQAVEGIYHNGHIKLFEMPKEIKQARVIVTFLDDSDEKTDETRHSLVGTIEILDDDLEAGSLEIRKMFNDAIEKSGEEFNRGEK